MRRNHFGPRRTPMGPQRYIPDLDRLERLRKALQYTANGSKNFVSDLIHKHETLGGWTIAQSPYVDQMIEKARENYRHIHVQAQTDDLAPRVTMEAMRGFTRRLRTSMVKRPSLGLEVNGLNILVTMTQDGTLALYEEDVYIGKVMTDGRLRIANMHGLQQLADELSRLGETYVDADARNWF